MRTLDFAFIGLGAANSLLILRMLEEGLLDGKSAIVLDPDPKKVNDKTYCFWANPDEPIVAFLDGMIVHSWGQIESKSGTEELDGMRYYMVESLGLYEEVRKRIQQSQEIAVVTNAVDRTSRTMDGVKLYTEDESFLVQRVFDSRPAYSKERIGSTVLQSFVGWRVNFDRSVFQGDTMRLMDFSIPQNESTQFMYVLPTSSTEALVEMTRFDREPLPSDLAESHLKSYLMGFSGSYDVVDTEEGIIPMSQCVAAHDEDSRITSTGGRAGKIKSTTGYAFKEMYGHANELVDLERNVATIAPRFLLPKKRWSRFRLYDFLLLFILKYKPHWGKPIFERLFSTQRTAQVLRFLEERSKLWWELQMFLKLPIAKFLWSVGASSWAFIKAAPQRWMPIATTLVLVGINSILPGQGTTIGMGLLIFMLFVFGIPHGALDGYSLSRKSGLVAFILRYVGIMFLVVLLWAASPVAGLITFFVYSAWHFGETDLEDWGAKHRGLAFFWGSIVLASIVLSHLDEVNVVFQAMKVPSLAISEASAWMWVRMLLFAGMVLGIWFGSIPWLVAVASLALGTRLNLALAFGIYFVLQHSMSGWNHLRVVERWTHTSMWIKALPFSLGAVVMFLLLFQFDRTSLLQWSSYFLVFLSALSLPHIYFMSRWYKAT